MEVQMRLFLVLLATSLLFSCSNAQVKGKIENSIKYLRNNFWPLRQFSDLEDVNHQVRAWLNTTANQRLHQTTGEKPINRFVKQALKP